MKKIITFPCAGGSSDMYKDWKIKKEIIRVDYKGHWHRMDETMSNSNEELYNDVLELIMSRVSKEDELIIFGHSMGGIVGWHVANKLQKLQYKVSRVCISSCLPPHLFPGTRVAEIKNDIELVELLVNNQQVSRQIVETNVFRAVMLPIIRNDIYLCQMYTREFNNNFVNIPVILFGGREDDLVDLGQMFEWNKCTEVKDVFLFEGGHFYFKDSLVCKQVCDILDSL